MADSAPNPARLIGEAEAAAYLGRSRTRFREQVRSRLLPQASDSNGNRPLWDRKLLDRYVDALSGIGDNDNSWDDSR